jgi:hypothetical protein
VAKARAQLAMLKPQSSSTKVTRPGVPQKSPSFEETLRRGRAAQAFEAEQKAAKEAEKVARRQREDEEKAEQKRKKSQGNRASTSRPPTLISGEEWRRNQAKIREDESEDEESVSPLIEKKKADEKAEKAERKKAEKAERKAEKKAEKKKAKVDKKKSEEEAEAEKEVEEQTKIEEQTEVEEQIEADKKSTKKVASISDSGALAASSEVDSQTSEKTKPVAPEESTSSKSAAEAQSTVASTEAPSGLQESTYDVLSISEDNDGAGEDVEQSASDQSGAEDNVDDASTLKTPEHLRHLREIEEGFTKLSESQKDAFMEVLYSWHTETGVDENNTFALEDLSRLVALRLAVRMRSLLEAIDEQGQSEADQADVEHHGTHQASTSPPIAEQPEQTQQEQTQLSAPEGTVNKNGKRPLDDDTKPLQGCGVRAHKRRALSTEPNSSSRKMDFADGATPSSTQKPVTVDSSMIKAGVIPAVNGDVIVFGTTPYAAATYAGVEAMSAAKMSKQSPQQHGKKRTAMDAGMLQPISPAPTKKSKLSEEESALITQAGHATEESQAEANITTPEELVPKPETTSDSIKASPVPTAHDAPKEEDSSATEPHTANEKSSDAKSSEDSKKSPATEQPVGKAKSTTNTSATSAEMQPRKAANNDNADNSIVKPTVAKEAPVSSRANNSNTDGKARPAAQKSTSKSSTMAMEKQQKNPANTTMSKQSSTKAVPSALDAKNTSAATKKQSFAGPAPPKRKGPPARRFIPSTPEEIQQMLAQQNRQSPAPQSAQSAVKPAAKKALADKTNTQREPQRQRAPVAAATTTKKQLGAATEKPAPQRSTAQKKRSSGKDEVIAPVSKSAKKQHINPSPSVPAKAAEKRGKRACDEDDESETVSKTAKKQRTDESPPLRERASRSKTAAATSKKPAVATQPRLHCPGYVSGLSSGDEESDDEPKPKKKAKGKTTGPVEEAKDEQTAPAATTTTTPSAANTTQQVPTNNTAAGPPRKKGIARSTNPQPEPKKKQKKPETEEEKEAKRVEKQAKKFLPPDWR